MTRKRRDLDAERRSLTAAAERLLAGTPLRSVTGKLTSTELITESGLRRDAVYRDHKDLVDDFTARAKSQLDTPSSIAKIADANRVLQDENDALKKQLAEERENVKTMIKIISELSLEVDQAREERTVLQQVPLLSAHSSAQRDSTKQGSP